MRRRRVAQPEGLTSLLDVLFILVFASLVQLAAVGNQRAAEAEAKAAAAIAAVTPDAGVTEAAPPVGVPVGVPGAVPGGAPPTADVLRRRALSDLAAAFEGRAAVIVRIAPDGMMRLLELGDRTVALGMPLLERVPDPDVVLAYLGDRSPELRVCRVVALRLGLANLRDHLVVIAADRPLADLSVALVSGLRTDAERCLAEQQGVAVVVDPSSTPSSQPAPSQSPEVP